MRNLLLKAVLIGALLLIACTPIKQNDNMAASRPHSNTISEESSDITSQEPSSLMSETISEQSSDMVSNELQPSTENARDLNVGDEYMYGERKSIYDTIEQEIRDTGNDACSLVSETLLNNGMLKKDEHVFFMVVNYVLLDGIGYHMVWEYGENEKYPDETYTIAYFYVDMETGCVFSEDPLTVGRDVLIKLR